MIFIKYEGKIYAVFRLINLDNLTHNLQLFDMQANGEWHLFQSKIYIYNGTIKNDEIDYLSFKSDTSNFNIPLEQITVYYIP